MDFKYLTYLLNEKKYQELKLELQDSEVADIAEFMDNLEKKQAFLFFRLLPKEMAADVFSYLSTEKQAEISDLVKEEELRNILNDLYFDDKLDLLEEMPANVVKKILKNTPIFERKLINQFLKYPQNSAGSIMTIEYVDLKKEMLVEESIERIRKTAPDKETIYTCYVVDSERHLEGTLSLKDLVLAHKDTKVKDIMRKEPIFANTHDDQDYVEDIFK